jgi:hypothetical protein
MSNSIFFEAFFDAVSGAGLFGKLPRPGAPTELIDSRTVEEFVASGDFDRSMECFGYHRVEDRIATAPADAHKIHIVGRNGALGVLSPDGESVTWYIDGVEVRGTEIMHASAPARDFDLVERRRDGGSFSMAAENMQHEHAGRR